MVISVDALERQLLDVIDILDEEGIDYHLEGGVLLGIVREQRLLPWDKDTDIAIMRPDLPKLLAVLPKFKKRGWRVSVRYHERENVFTDVGDIALVKIKDKKFGFLAGEHILDLFIKTQKGDEVFWQAGGNIMRSKMSYFTGVETVRWRDRDVKVPLNYKDFLTEKYGDWSVVVKDWSVDDEKTIVEPRPDKED